MTGVYEHCYRRQSRSQIPRFTSTPTQSRGSSSRPRKWLLQLVDEEVEEDFDMEANKNYNEDNLGLL